MPLDPGRHLHAACPVFGEGVLVCPTNAGVVVGVDVATPGLAWAYPYRSEPLTQSQTFPGRGRRVRARVAGEWQATVTVVAGGRVVFAAADAPALHCVDVQDGSPLWNVPRAEEDLFVAGVFGGRVLVVGKHACRALDLAGGRQVWQVETGPPAGRGICRGDVYYLPVKVVAEDKGPGVCAIDLRRGSVTARTPAPGKDGLGNLLEGPGGVFSQTAIALTALARRHGPAY
jgi:outer membrane protein assembly factor BamB